MSKSIKILLIVLAVLVVLGAVGTAYWLGQKQEKQKETESFIPKGWTEESKQEIKEETKAQEGTKVGPQSGINPEQFSYQTYISADQKFSFDYPQQWIKSEISNPSSVLPQNLITKYNAKIPVVVTYSSQTELVQISLMYYEFKAGQTPAQAMDELIKDAKSRGKEMEILNQESAPKSHLIESKMEEQNLKLRTKEKLFFLEEGEKQPAYIFSISVLEKDWAKYASLVDYLLGRVKVVE